MQKIVENGVLAIPLYHGTSSLFLDSICKHGLGAKNPIEDWKILELARDILPLCEAHLQDFETYQVRSLSFRNMVEQKITAGGFNFQHGDTYLSPSRQTAVNYAAHNRCGSELITHTIDLLKELGRRNIPDFKTKLFKKHPEGFRLLDIDPAPILIEANCIPTASLKSEHGDDGTKNLERLQEYAQMEPEVGDALKQQLNFRLSSPISSKDLKIWFVNVIQQKAWGFPDYSLYRLQPEG